MYSGKINNQPVELDAVDTRAGQRLLQRHTTGVALDGGHTIKEFRLALRLQGVRINRWPIRQAVQIEVQDSTLHEGPATVLNRVRTPSGCVRS